ncbi:helix-turn-helix domain-containing protein [Halovivax cerinus]|uniref:Helix-turn-helix domain-containing protein n=1 Tax=Halovivax cerinus TaxID=1487865 RepID=A0ABD5NT87_9EURY|nr:helix-turn-helix domain-containing protein [Halovivax cerinus]
MATEATVTVPAEQFPLGTIFERLPGVTVQLERIIPANDVVIPYFWVRGTDVDDVEGAFDDHPGVEAIRYVDSVENQHLLRVEWSLEYDGILQTLMETGVPLISAEGTSTEWHFDVRGDDREDIASFQRGCRERDIPITLTKLHSLTPIDAEAEVGLTDAQREALVLAFERGYFNTPRDVTMTDLGEELDISHQAVASRLRRGISHILGETLPDLRPMDSVT